MIGRRRRGAGRRRRVRWPRSRRGRGLLAAVLVVVVLWVGVCWRLVGEPRLDPLGPADAVVVLGPPDVNGRMDEAYRLIAGGYAKTLVVSVTSEQQRNAKHICTDGLAGVSVVCFRPQPATTQGEAREIRTLAGERGWTSVIVVTSTYHVSRARMIVRRCFHGRVIMVAASQRIGVLNWAREFGYQTGAYLKAELFTRGC